MAEICTSILPQKQLIRIYPNLGFYAIKSNAGGSWKLWEFARFLDIKGSGAILEEDLFSLCNKLQVNGGTYKRWLKQAIDLGLFRSVYSGKKLIILGIVKVCLTFGCTHVNTRQVEMPIECLAGKDWRAWLWTSYEMEFKGHPISRNTMYELTSKHPQTQRRYDNQTKVIRHKNYAISNLNESHLTMEQERGMHKGLFVMNTGHKKVLAWRLPDARSSEVVGLIGKGMSRKVNHILGSYHTPGASVEWVRLFNQTEDQLKTTNHKLARPDYKHPHEVYSLCHKTNKTSLWEIR